MSPLRVESQSLVRVKITGRGAPLEDLVRRMNSEILEGLLPWDVGPITREPGRMYISYWLAGDAPEILAWLKSQSLTSSTTSS